MGKKLLSVFFLFFIFLLNPLDGFGQVCPTSVSITANPGTTICAGTNVTFTANASGGSAYTYKWFLNGTEQTSETEQSFTPTSLSNSDKIKVVTSSSNDATCTPKESTVTMTVNSTASISFNIIANKTSICPGGSVTLSAGPITNGGTSPSYQWRKNGNPISGATSSTFTTADINSTDKFTLEVKSSAQCASPMPAVSTNEINVTVNDLPTITTVDASVCADGQSSIDLRSLVSGSGTTYTFYTSEANAINKTGAINSVVSPTTQTIYYVRSELPTGCFETDSINISITGLPTVDAGSDQAICGGETFDLATIGSGINRTYYTSQANANNKTNALTSSVVSPQSTSTYYVRAETDEGCYSTDSVLINIKPDATITLASTSKDITVCQYTSISNIKFNIGGGGTGATVTGLPNGLSYSDSNNVINISGTPSENGSFTYTIKSLGCGEAIVTGNIKVDPPINNLTPELDPTNTNHNKTAICPVVSGLVYTIKPIPGATSYSWTFPTGWTPTTGTVSGNSTVTSAPTVIVTAGTNATAGTIKIRGKNSCSEPSKELTLPVGVNSFAYANAGPDQTVCLGTSQITLAGEVGGAISHKNDYFWTTSVAGGELPSAQDNNKLKGIYKLPPNIRDTGGIITLTLTTIDPQGTCTKAEDTMVIKVLKQATIVPPDDILKNPILCKDTQLTPIIFEIGEAGTGATASNLPPGVIGNFAGNKFTITGKPTETGVYTYTITTIGSCSQLQSSTTGKITVNSNPTIDAPENRNQSICIGDSIGKVNFQIGSPGTGASVTGLPEGIVTSYSEGIFSISGVPLEIGTFNYTVTTSGPCTQSTVNGSLTITPNPEITAIGTKDQSLCINEPLAPISFSISAPGDGATVTNLPEGLDGAFSNGTYTISGTPTESGTFLYEVTTTGECSQSSISGKIEVSSLTTVELGDDVTICSNESAELYANLGGGASSGVWTTSGTGQFTNNSINGVYTPSQQDISNGSVEIAFTTDDPSGNCASGTDTLTLVILEEIQILTQPQNVGVCVSQPASLSVVAYGDDLSYQWYKGSPGQAVVNNQKISGATSPTLTINQTTLSDTATYYVVIGDNIICEEYKSNEVTLNVNEDIIINGSPSSQTVCKDQEVTLSISATGDIESYQWRKNGIPIEGEVASNYTFNATETADYDVIVNGLNNICSPLPSAVAKITVNLPPQVIIEETEKEVEICMANSNFNITEGVNVANVSSILWSVDEEFGTIANATSATEATFTPAQGITSPIIITITGNGLAGCSTPVTAIKKITIQPLPTVTAITYGDGLTEFCDSGNSPVPVVTGTNAYEEGTFSWVLSEGETGNKTLNINSSTGVISAGSTPGSYQITYSTPTGAICGVIEKTFPIKITKLPVATFNYTSNSFCKSSSNPSPVIPDGSSIGLFTSTPEGLSIDASTGEINIASSAIGTYTITNSIAAAKGCLIQTASQTVILDPIPVGGTLSFGTVGRIFMVCESPTAASLTPLTLSGITGQVIAWKYRKSSATSWTTITENNNNFTGLTLTPAKIHSLGLNETISFQVEIGSGACNSVLSPRAILSVIPSDIEPAPVTITPGVVCFNAFVTLSSSTGYASGGDIGGGEFDNSSITNFGWRVKKDGNNTDLGFNSGANNTRPAIWLRVNPHEFSTANVDNPTNNPPDVLWDSNPTNQGNKGFAIISGNNAATLETPIFNTYAMETGKLTFDQAYNLTTGASISVEISTDGGATYQTPPLYYKEGPESSGFFNGFSAGDGDNQISLNLENYLGEGNIRIRFHFIGKRVGDVWAIDNMDLPDGPNGVGMVWRDYTDPAAPITIGTNTSEQWQPKIIGWNTFEVRTTLQLNSVGQACQSIENFERVKAFVFDTYTVTASAVGGSCGNNSAKLGATVVSGTKGAMVEFQTPGYTTPDGYTGNWEVTGPSGYTFSATHFSPAVNDPNAVFTPNFQGEFNLTWKLTPTTKGEDGKLIENQTCPPVSTPIKVTIQDCSKLDFDGTDDFVDLVKTYNDGPYSVEAWIRPETTTGTIISGPKFEITMNDLPATVVPNTRWYHIAASNGRLYIDGIDVKAFTLRNGSERAFIGAKWTAPNATNHFSGWIEEVRIWKGDISVENIRFTMNQRIKATGYIGVEVDMEHPDAPAFENLAGYYQLLTTTILNGGYTPDLAGTAVNGKLRNMTSAQENTAPLPYTSNTNVTGQNWDTDNTWTHHGVWDPPYSFGIDETTKIEWNIVRASTNILSNNKDIKVLGLISEKETLNMEGSNPTGWQSGEGGTGDGLYISHYLLLDGKIDLNGESQLIQPELSIVVQSDNINREVTGWLERDQQGTESSYNYNYWSSPVSPATKNAAFNIKAVMRDGTNSATPGDLVFGPEGDYSFADGTYTGNKRVSSYWLNTFHGRENVYADWNRVKPTDPIVVGEGYTMKGTSGSAAIASSQNYTFRGVPNNGTVILNMDLSENYLVGNPYPSAIDAERFFTDNNKKFNGALYFWSHFGGKSHILKEYVGGYGTYNMMGATTVATNVDSRIDTTDYNIEGKRPDRFIPVAQSFFITTSIDPNKPQGNDDINPGNIIFNNSQREFHMENQGGSFFLKPENGDKGKNTYKDERQKIWIVFNSPTGYQREILVGVDPNTTTGFDWGYDAPLIEYLVEDMFWLIGSTELVIQGIPDFNIERVIPIGLVIDQKDKFSIDIKEMINIPESKNIYLKDKLNDTIHDLRKSEYVSTSEPGYINDRFELVFFKEEPPVIEVPGEIPGEEYINLTITHAHDLRQIRIINPEELAISGVYLFDINGNLIDSYGNLPNEKEFKLNVASYATGVYLVKVYAKGKVITKKIIISN